MAKRQRTCKQALEARGIQVFETVKGEFVAYKPAKRGGEVKTDFDLVTALEALDFWDYEEIACGRGCYVMGDVNMPVDE